MALLSFLANSPTDEKGGWSLIDGSERSQAIASSLLESTNAAWRAAAVYVSGKRPLTAISLFEKFRRDPNPWVRAAAVHALAKAAPDRAQLEERLGEMLKDADPNVAEIAALGLLEPEIREAAGLQWQFENFHFEELQASSSEYRSSSEERPLTTLEGKPAFLEQARRRMGSMKTAESAPFVLLLAQYGQFDELDRVIAQKSEPALMPERQFPDAILTGVALSQGAKYIPFIRSLVDKASGEWDLRKLLKAVKGMSGPEARQLRLDINKRLRKSSE